jgi:2-oxoisovalerate dehydrogenase E1 component alpha subunit
MTCRGEEAIHFGSASALDPADTIFAQYREAGPLMWRGFTLEQFANQCFSNDADLGKGRQMPVHYGCRALHYQTISSPLGTQIPQAVGAAYHLKLQGKPNVTVCYFGDGAASTTDFHSAMNFAATLKTPVLFICRNNGFAISTPVTDQYAGDGIVSRAPGYGMAAIRVDGNDIFAVHAAVREARAYALEHSAPVMIEAMTYRLGHHSTSDDSARYRDKQAVDVCEREHDPMSRFEKFLKEQGLIDDASVSAARDEEKRAVLKAMGDAEKRPPPPLESLFSDVYHEMTPRLKQQQAQLQAHLKKYKNKY